MSTAHPGEDDPTTAMPRVEAPQAAPRVPYTPPPVEEAIVVGPAPAPPRRLTNVSPAIIGAPVGNPFGYALARFFAVAIDLGLVAGVLTLLAYALIAINPITGLPTNTQRGFDATLAMGFVLALIYGITFEALFGTTVGKLAMGLHVHAVRDRRLGFGRAFVRSILRPFDLLVIGGVLAMLPGHRRLGDFAAGTGTRRTLAGSRSSLSPPFRSSWSASRARSPASWPSSNSRRESVRASSCWRSTRSHSSRTRGSRRAANDADSAKFPRL
jgi:uncharacterized RDD family membrane protein YckC